MLSKLADAILQDILRHCAPEQVILYGEKRTLATSEVKSLDFCIILPAADKPALLRKLYLAIESPIPFNLLLYTCEEWAELTADFSSYAAAIQKKGTVLYGKEP